MLFRSHLVAGFGRAMRVEAKDVLLDTSAAGELLAAEAELIERFGADPARVAGWARALGGGAGEWVVCGLDPEGLDLTTTASEGRAFRRLVLQDPASNPLNFSQAVNRWEEAVRTQKIA